MSNIVYRKDPMVRFTLRTLYTIACVAMISITMTAAAPAFFGQSNAYTVRHDNGGRIIDYAIKMKRIERDNKAIRFDGPCYSACTLFLSVSSSRACVTPRASFGFHLPHGSSAKSGREAASFLIASYPDWVRSWLQAHGGLTKQLKVMPYKIASKHLADCTTGNNSVVG